MYSGSKYRLGILGILLNVVIVYRVGFSHFEWNPEPFWLGANTQPRFPYVVPRTAIAATVPTEGLNKAPHIRINHRSCQTIKAPSSSLAYFKWMHPDLKYKNKANYLRKLIKACFRCGLWMHAELMSYSWGQYQHQCRVFYRGWTVKHRDDSTCVEYEQGCLGATLREGRPHTLKKLTQWHLGLFKRGRCSVAWKDLIVLLLSGSILPRLGTQSRPRTDRLWAEQETPRPWST